MYSKFPLAIQEPFFADCPAIRLAGVTPPCSFPCLAGGRAGVSINSPAAANTSLLASIVRAQTIPSARERCICSGVWRSVTIPS